MATSKDGAVGAELSRLFQIAELDEQAASRDRCVDIAATVAELAALARRFGLLSIDRFVVRVVLKLDRQGNLLLQGWMEAAFMQRCVTTLEPMPARLKEDFALVFARDGLEEGCYDGDLALPEPWPGEILDVGEIAAQQLGLALDPYPKSSGATVDMGALEGPEGTHKPFSGLAELRDSLLEKA